jgi:hypothetical protein
MCRCGEPVCIEVVPMSKRLLDSTQVKTYRIKCTHPDCRHWLMVQYNDYEQGNVRVHARRHHGGHASEVESGGARMTSAKKREGEM